MENQPLNVSPYLLRPCRNWDEAVRDLTGQVTPSERARPHCQRTPGGLANPMTSCPVTGAALEDRLRVLGRLDRAELAERWVEVHGTAPPKTLTCDLLVRGIACGIQEQEIGGLSPAEKKALAVLAQGTKTSSPGPLRAGTRLYREWQGITHEVLVLENGYGWRDQAYGSLSKVARAITGTRWSGPRFFGIRP